MKNYKWTVLIDKPDNRDYQADHLLGSFDFVIPEEVNLIDNCEVHNQGNTMHCTAYWITHIHQILNTIERKNKIKLNPIEQWENQKKDPWTASEKNGDYLQSALKSLKKFWLNYNWEKLTIDWYAVVHRGSFKKYLAKWMPIYTWNHFTATNYKKAKETGFWGGIDWPTTWWHAIAIVGYDKNNNYIAVNSWGKNWWYFKNWTFLIKEKDLENLFTSYVIFDTVDIEKIFKDVSEKSPLANSIKWASDNWLVKWYGDENLPNEEKLFLPDREISRAEVCVVLKRFYDLIKK